MKTKNEIMEMIHKLDDVRSALAWWDDGREQMACIIDALLWVIGDESGKPIDPAQWEAET